MIVPARRARIHGSTALVQINGPRTLTFSTSHHSSRSMSATDPTAIAPALLTNTSTPPKRCTLRATARSATAGSVTSPTTISTAPAALGSNDAVSSSPSADRP